MRIIEYKESNGILNPGLLLLNRSYYPLHQPHIQAYRAEYSQAVTHLRNNQTLQCLTSVIVSGTQDCRENKKNGFEIRKRHLKFLIHTMWKEGLENVTHMGHIEGKINHRKISNIQSNLIV